MEDNKSLNESIKKLEVCPECKAVINGENFCHNCGKNLYEIINKYCGRCGNKLSDKAKFCDKCGNNIEQQSFNRTDYNNSNNSTNNIDKKSPLALGGFICSIIGLFVFPYIFGIVAIVLGIIAICQENICKTSKKHAKTAIILGVIDIVASIFIQVSLIGFFGAL